MVRGISGGGGIHHTGDLSGSPSWNWTVDQAIKYCSEGDMSAARSYVDDLKKNPPNETIRTLVNDAYSYLINGRPDEALKCLEKCKM